MDGQAAGIAVQPLNRRGRFAILAVLLALGIVVAGGFVLARNTATTDESPADDLAPNSASSKGFKEFAAAYLPSWPADRTPELVLLFTGQQHNYEAPCGCTEPQAGGLERRYNFFSQIRGFGFPTVAMDLGDIYFVDTHSGDIDTTNAIRHQSDQLMLKYQLSMKSLTVMQYDAVNVGPEEFKIPLDWALEHTVLNYNNCPYEVLCASITDDKNAVYPTGDARGSTLKDYRVVSPKASKIKVGVVGALGPKAIEEIQKNNQRAVQFGKEETVLPAALAAMKSKAPEIRVLLYQGTKAEAEHLAQSLDEFDIIQYLTQDSEPPEQADRAKAAPGKSQPKAQLVTVGWKGRWIGVMGVFRSADNSLDMRWNVVKLEPDFRTPAGKREEHPIVKLLENYTAKVKEQNLLARYGRSLDPAQTTLTKNGQPVQPKFLGSEACKKCHKNEYDIWDSSRHAGAYQTLSENPKAFPPHNRQFDGECVVCHTVGFRYSTGFRDSASGYTNEEKSKHLFGNGCENCHGPGSLHADDPKNVDFKKAISPWKENPNDHLTKRALETDEARDDDPKKKAVPEAERKVVQKVFKTCFMCHDTDNDHDFHIDKKWKEIATGPTAKKK